MAVSVTGRSGRRRRRAMSEINVVPYIDVMLVLLIIFMVTAPLLNLGVGIDLPKTNAQALQQKQNPIVVSVDRSTPVGMCGSTPAGFGGRAALCTGGACARVSSRATWSLPWKSAMACSASTSVMSPRRTSDST